MNKLKIERNIQQSLAILTANPQNLLYPGVDRASISNLEMELGLELPLTFKDFLKVTDGAQLYQNEEILGVEEDQSGARRTIIEVLKVRELANLPNFFIPFHSGGVYHCFNGTKRLLHGEYEIVSLSNAGLMLQGKKYTSFADWLYKYIIDEYEQGA